MVFKKIDTTAVTSVADADMRQHGENDSESGVEADRVAIPADRFGALEVLWPDLDACATADTTVLLVVDGQVVERVAAEPQHGFTLIGTIRAGWIVAWSPTGGLRSAQRESLVGEVELVPRGRSLVEGHMYGPAEFYPEGVTLELVASGQVLSEESAELEAILASSFGDLRIQKVCIGADGHFRASNLKDDWSGVLRIDDRHCFVPSPELGRWLTDEHGRSFALSLEQPRKDLRLLVERAPSLEGRLVWSDDGQPVEGAEVRLNVSCIPQSGCPPVSPRSDASGAFRTVLPPRLGVAPEQWWGGEWRSSLDKVLIEVGAPDGSHVHFVRDLREILPEGNLGVLAVPRGGSMILRIVDGEGAAVRGAVCTLGRRAVRGDDQGMMTLTGCLPGDRLSIGARGFDRSVVEIEEETLRSSQPREVVLLPGTDLTIEVQDSLGRIPDGLLLSAVCDWDFAGRPIDWGALRLHDELTGSKCRGASLGEDDRTKLDLRPVDDGRFVLLGVRPHSLLAVVVRGPSSAPLLEAMVAAPQLGQTSVVRLNLPFTLGLVSGRVTGADGVPLSDAKVRLNGADGESFARSDGDGRYRLRAVRLPASNLELTVERDGYVPARVPLSHVDLDQELAPVVLRTAHRLRVQVIDTDGRSVVGAYVSVESNDGAVAAGTEIGEGNYDVENVGGGPSVVVVQRESFTYRRPLDVWTPEVVVDVPSLAALEVLYAGAASEKIPGSWLTLEVLSLSGEQVVQGPFEKRDAERRCTVQLEPGRYRVRIERARMLQQGIQREPITEEVDVEVLPGRTTQVTLDR